MNVHHYRLFAILVAIVVIPPVHARAGAYSFSLIVDQASLPQPTQGLGSVLSPHALGLNKNGTAVFATYNVNFANLASGTRIYTANAGGPLNLIAAEGSSGQVIQNLAPFGVGESINDSGVVAYWKSTQAPTGSTEGIYRSDGATIYEVVATSSNQLLPQEPTAINNSGEVAFLVDNTIDATHSQQALMKGNGSTLVTVASVSNNRFSSIDNAYPAINSAGAVAFPAHGPVPLTSGIYVGSGGPLTTIISSTDNSVGYFNPSLNDFGKGVAVVGQFY
ncbi:MAG: hypothetical protein HY288_14965 [Planctomycetia bacterium]|nr:hypothetical protein [Planctomycetia bacterium]